MGQLNRDYPNTVITGMGAWSCGRHGAENYLNKATDDQLKQLNYLIMLDPGGRGDMATDAANNATAGFNRWFRLNAKARLVIMAGSPTYEYGTFAGVITAWGWGVLTNAHTKVCTYAGLSHNQIFWDAQYWIAHHIDGGCPWLQDSGQWVKSTSNGGLIKYFA